MFSLTTFYHFWLYNTFMALLNWISKDGKSENSHFDTNFIMEPLTTIFLERALRYSNVDLEKNSTSDAIVAHACEYIDV